MHLSSFGFVPAPTQARYYPLSVLGDKNAAPDLWQGWSASPKAVLRIPRETGDTLHQDAAFWASSAGDIRAKASSLAGHVRFSNRPSGVKHVSQVALPLTNG